jgi:predicted nucleic acid-binding protein
MNVLGFHVRGRVVDRDGAVRLYRRGLGMVKIDEFEPNTVTMFNLCQRTGCSTYDLEFVALAIHHGIPLVTADKQIIRAFSNIAMDLTKQ